MSESNGADSIILVVDGIKYVRFDVASNWRKQRDALDLLKHAARAYREARDEYERSSDGKSYGVGATHTALLAAARDLPDER